MSYQYDVAVLGGGPGGYEAAIRCAQLGLRTALIECESLGGTCLNRGCIPTKALLQSSHTYESAKKAAAFGVTTGEVGFDYGKIAARKDWVVKTLVHGVEVMEKAYGVQVIRGFGRLQDAHTIAVDAQTVTAENLILATGSEPSHPPIPGIDGAHILNSTELLALTEAPESLVIVGGGVIGLEFATVYAALGRKVTILEMLPELLPGIDADITRQVTKSLTDRGVEFLLGAKVLSLTGGDRVSVRYEQAGREGAVEAAYSLVCVGRRPRTKDIGLESVGITAERGFIPVDETLRTCVPNIYAIGDITGKVQLAHVASAQGVTAAANCAGRHETIGYDIVPTCIYVEPELAYVGLSEEKAREAGHTVRIGRFNAATNGKTLIMGESGAVKLVFDADTGEVLGAQILAPRATDLIAEIAAVMKSEGTLEELSATIHPHPSVSEILMEAAHDAEGLCCNAMPKRKS